MIITLVNKYYKNIALFTMIFGPGLRRKSDPDPTHLKTGSETEPFQEPDPQTIITSGSATVICISCCCEQIIQCFTHGTYIRWFFGKRCARLE